MSWGTAGCSQAGSEERPAPGVLRPDGLPGMPVARPMPHPKAETPAGEGVAVDDPPGAGGATAPAERPGARGGELAGCGGEHSPQPEASLRRAGGQTARPRAGPGGDGYHWLGVDGQPAADLAVRAGV